MDGGRGLIILVVLFFGIIRPWGMGQSPESTLKILQSMDAVRGEQLFHDKGCFDCHSYDNWGEMFGPDLGPNRIRGASPSSLAAAMWNHAPSMWSGIRSGSSSGNVPSLSTDESAAIFAFFYSRLYFNDLSDSPRGEDLFKSRCASCHDLRVTTGSSKPGPPVASWGNIKDPIALVGRMWNHSVEMLDQSLRAGRSWPRLSAQDSTDIVAYLWRLPEVRPGKSAFTFGDDTKGRNVFSAQCKGCHTLDSASSADKIDLTSRLRGVTIPQMIAAMWNHAPAMKVRQPGIPLPALNEADTRDLMTYFVVGRVLQETGNATRGGQIFNDKACGRCHGGPIRDTGAPALSAIKGPIDAVRMTAALWSHGPKMLDMMNRENIKWPRFKGPEMLDLLTYMTRQSAK